MRRLIFGLHPLHQPAKRSGCLERLFFPVRAPAQWADEAPKMSCRTAAWVAWSIWSASLLLWSASFALRTFGNVSTGVERAITTLLFVALSTAGALVASRRPESPFGWIVSTYGLLVSFEGVVIGYAITATGPAGAGFLGDGTAAAVLGVWIAPIATGLLTLGLMRVPDGHLPSPRWRPVMWFVIASALLGAVTSLLAPGNLANARPNPFGIGGAEDLLPQVRGLSRTLLLIGFGAAVASLAVRFRGAVGEQRQQLKWVAVGALAWALVTLIVRVNPAGLRPFLGYIYLSGLLAFVAAVSVAILRYRLYDVDLVISRALVYGGLGACITVMYVGVVAGIGTLAHLSTEADLGLSLVVAAVVAVIFQPAGSASRAWLIDWSMAAAPAPMRCSPIFEPHRRRPDGGRGPAAHGRSSGARRACQRQPSARLCTRWPGAGRHLADWSARGRVDRSVPVFHQGTPVGEIAVSKPEREPLTSAEVNLLTESGRAGRASLRECTTGHRTADTPGGAPGVAPADRGRAGCGAASPRTGYPRWRAAAIRRDCRESASRPGVGPERPRGSRGLAW